MELFQVGIYVPFSWKEACLIFKYSLSGIFILTTSASESTIHDNLEHRPPYNTEKGSSKTVRDFCELKYIKTTYLVIINAIYKDYVVV